ncbi:hypothetical protein B0H17DRAFT_1057076 [Mycena rosella]|uniref:SGNH hydrolase-type esterase domain-containing protein n=1 Tax=Mycena rosella TaxID=1033263 RepID=A0AAD7DMW8_MYCRO|nr:hypothetical protein B0H17DRAFT_1057076 [Mycena rosella]
MLAVSGTKPASPKGNPVVETRTLDAEPGMVIKLWDEPIQQHENGEDEEGETISCNVEITLIDWASILETDGFISDRTEHVDRDLTVANHQILFFGDSMTCGLALEASDGGQPVPHGILDAFPSQTISILREKHSYLLSLDVVAYPGISLVGLDDSGSSLVTGMVDRFFHVSFTLGTPWTPWGSPQFICFALGTNDEANDVLPQIFRSTLERLIRTLSATFPSVKAFYVITVESLHPTCSGHNHLAGNLARYLKAQRPPPDSEG